ncbi:probable methyltransferase-like protein 15 homolog isoform X2 [Apis mellifera]|uniref:Probable methyltransferase-like protein 15 homolog isoform X2 n=1 Tax=Apis mellifera TaxID=7460 RepID=A0A7M7GMA0_APIME|nr:probable methyltransferase-like protein 15 homolog isoform X2 [Apis mellifera]|eukprot:XP_006559839.1 probable methyltransferase-like protein 15 homolog isoform X2 [Apis mellifera]
MLLKKMNNMIHIYRYCSMKYLSRNIYYLFRKQNDIIYLKNSRKYSKIINENDNIENTSHIPVMVNEVLHYLEPSPGKIFVDMTFGAGGHSMKILESSPNIKIFALDRDPIAHQFALKLSEKYPEQIIPLLGRFSELPQLLCKYKVNVNSIDGFLFDFGCSSMQLDIGERGFSLSKDGPLDMRMDGFRYPQEPTAAEVLKEITEEDLAFILKIYEKRFDQLGRFTHCATKTFQALRIFVNNELNEINYGIIIAGFYLKTNGRLITISFHSLEDTIVKRHMSANITETVANKIPLKFSDYGKHYTLTEMKALNRIPWKMLHKHVITPTEEEINKNPRSRSAKFRAITKVI